MKNKKIQVRKKGEEKRRKSEHENWPFWTCPVTIILLFYTCFVFGAKLQACPAEVTKVSD